MLLLPNGCSCSNPTVFPKNWEKGKPDMSVNWYIRYRFYDPKRPKPKQVVIKGMNSFKELSARRSATKALLENELTMLQHQGYNPFLGQLIRSEEMVGDIDPYTPFIPALRAALKIIEKSEKTKAEIESVLTGFEKAAVIAGLASIPISTVTRRHIKKIFIHCKETVSVWSANRFNSYRAYLMMLFNELIEQEATEIDPLSKIKRQKVVRRIREVLSDDQRKQVNDHLKKKNYQFWRFVQIFFHSGARATELMQIRNKDVDLAGQRFKVIIKKGKQHTEVRKVIKSIALPFWTEIMSQAAEGDYLFSLDLKPGPVAVSASQINRRWKVHVKDPKRENKKGENVGGLGIPIDFYSLKHLNLDETAKTLSNQGDGVKDAAAMASHSTPVITLKHYLVGEKERQDERLKGVGNSFSQ